MERQLGGLAEQALDAVRILLAGNLHQDAIVALALDGGLAGTDLVDPPAHDLEGLRDSRTLYFLRHALGQPDFDAVACLGEHQLARHATLIQLLEHLQRPRCACRIGQRQRHGVTAHAEPAVADALAAQGATHVVDQGFQALPDHRAELDLQ